MFAGLISRWMMPARWAVSTAPEIWMMVRRASAMLRGLRRATVHSWGGGQYSMTM